MPDDDDTDASGLTTRQLYASMTTDQLVTLRDAFTLDLRDADLLATKVFCNQRIALIGELLRERMREAAREKRKERKAERAGRGDRGRASDDAPSQEKP